MAMLRHDDLVVPIPPDWEDGSQLVIVGKDDGGFRPNVVISRAQAEGRSIEGFVQHHSPMLQQALQDYEVIGQGPERFGATHGFLVEHTFAANNVRLHQIQFHVLVGGNVFTFTGTHLADRFETVRPTMTEVIGRTRLGVDTFMA
jgi:hypothetical protein